MIKHLLLVLTAALALTACSSDDDGGGTSEYNNWQSRNEAYFNDLYTRAQSDPTLTAYPTYAGRDNTKATNNIVVQVVEQGNAAAPTPLYTDSVYVHYRGYLMPTPEHTAKSQDGTEVGLKFDSSWKTPTLDTQTAVPLKSSVAGFIEGFATALQHMRPGDRWLVYIPANLGYGTSTSGSIPAGSTLIFDIKLHSFGHPGTPMPAFK